MQHPVRSLVVAGAVLSACGGGGSELVVGQLAPWEIEPGLCSFDDRRAQMIAIDMGSDCAISMWGNTVEGQKFPAKSWPSTEYVWK